MIEKSAFTSPSLEEAKQLYEIAMRVQALAPWEWLDETQVFGMQHPETGELGFVSVMGMAGEHFAVALYQGAEGLYGFRDLESGGVANPEQVLEIPQLQASFEDRDMLQKQDRDLIKKLGLKFRGANAWPMFRSYRPGFLPWFVTAEEARFLTYALAQTLEVAPRVKNDPDILSGNGENSYLVRTAHRQAVQLVWEDQLLRVERPEPVRLPVTWDVELLGQLKQLPRREFELEVDLSAMPTPVAEKGERPYLPYLLLQVDGQSGMVIGFELLKPENSLAELWSQIPMKLAHWLAEAEVVPEKIRVRSELLLELLAPLAKTLHVKFRRSDSLPGVDAATNSMFGWMTGGDF